MMMTAFLLEAIAVVMFVVGLVVGLDQHSEWWDFGVFAAAMLGFGFAARGSA